MAASCQITLLTILLVFLHENAHCTKDFQSFFQRRTARLKKSWHGKARERRATTSNTPTPTAKDKETNKLVLAALYGGLGQGISSSTNFDYANGLNPKILGAGGYGLPPGVYSYAFDPTTGMPFMCDPTKTPPGAGKSQTAGAAAINPPAASKPASDQPSDNAPSENVPSENTSSQNVPSENTSSENAPSENTSSEISASTSASSQDFHSPSGNTDKVTSTPSPSGTNIVGTNVVPEHRLSPIGHTPSSHKVQNFASPTSNTNPTTLPGKGATTAPGNDDDLMASSPSNKVINGVSPTPNQGKITSAVPDKVTSSGHLTDKPSTTAPQHSTGSKVENQISNDVSNAVQPSGVTQSSKGVQIKLGPPLYVPKPKTTPQSSASNKNAEQRLTPIIDNYHKELKLNEGTKVKRSNTLKTYLKTKKMAKKNDITIKLPDIPACPDMKNYHWPWNCLDKNKAVKKECIQNSRGTFSYKGATFPYEDYGQLYENGNYYDKKE